MRVPLQGAVHAPERLNGHEDGSIPRRSGFGQNADHRESLLVLVAGECTRAVAGRKALAQRKPRGRACDGFKRLAEVAACREWARSALVDESTRGADECSSARPIAEGKRRRPSDIASLGREPAHGRDRYEWEHFVAKVHGSKQQGGTAAAGADENVELFGGAYARLLDHSFDLNDRDRHRQGKCEQQRQPGKDGTGAAEFAFEKEKDVHGYVCFFNRKANSIAPFACAPGPESDRRSAYRA